MPYRVNLPGYDNALALIRAGKTSREPWSFDAADGDALLGSKGDDWANYSRFHLAVDPEKPADTKAHYHFPVGKAGKVYRRALARDRQRASQFKHAAVFEAAGRLFDEWDKVEAGDKGAKMSAETMSALAIEVPTVAFAETTTPAIGEQWVVRKGKISEAGEWDFPHLPGGKFRLTPEDLKNEAARFEVVDIDISHVPSILDGKLGTLFEVEAKDGVLYGTTRLPKWLDDQLADHERKVSCKWDSKTKRINKLSLVPNPRIEDAVLFAAFAAAGGQVERTWEGFRTLAEAYGVLPPEQAAASFAARKQADDASRLMQQIHEALADFDPDVCDPAWEPAGFSAAQFADWPKQVKAMKAIHNLTIDHGATCSGVVAMSAEPIPKGTIMTKTDTVLQALFGDKASTVKANLTVPEDKADEVIAAQFAVAPPPAGTPGGETPKGEESKPKSPETPRVETPAPAPAASFADSPEAKALRDKNADLERRIAEQERQQKLREEQAINNRTAAFARELIRKYDPHTAKPLVAAFAQVARISPDQATSVKFSRGGQEVVGSPADAMEAWAAGLPDNVMLREVLAPAAGLPDGIEALFHKAAEEPEDAEARGRRLYREGRGLETAKS